MHSNLVQVIIINWNGKNFLSACLDGLRQQVYEPVSITFVDNGSEDGSVDFVARNYPEVQTIALSKNVGFSSANNIAFETVQTEYIALLNNDAVPHPLWLKTLVKALESHPEAGCAASKILFYDNPKIIDRAGDSYTRAGAGLLRGRGTSATNYSRQEWIFGACAGAALYRTRMLRDIGFFDEEFFLLYEDVDLSFRAQLQGYKCIYVPDAIVYHRASVSIGYDSAISVYYSHRNLEWVYIQNMPGQLILRTIFPHILYNIAALLYFIAKGLSKEYIKAKWDALKGFKKALEKRKKNQKNRIVEIDYIWGLLERELFFTRLIRRLKRS